MLQGVLQLAPGVAYTGLLFQQVRVAPGPVHFICGGERVLERAIPGVEPRHAFVGICVDIMHQIRAKRLERATVVSNYDHAQILVQ